MENWSAWVAYGFLFFMLGRIINIGTTPSIRMPQWLASLFNWPRPKGMPKRAVSAVGLGSQATVLVMILYRLFVEGTGLSGPAFGGPVAFVGVLGSLFVSNLIARQLLRISPYPLPTTTEFYLERAFPFTLLVGIIADEFDINRDDFEMVQSFDSEEDWLKSSHPRLWIERFTRGDFPLRISIIVSSIDTDYLAGLDVEETLSRLAKRLDTRVLSPHDKSNQRSLNTWTLLEAAGGIRYVKPNRELLASEDFGIQIEEFLD